MSDELLDTMSDEELKEQLIGLKVQIGGGYGNPQRLNHQFKIIATELRERVGNEEYLAIMKEIARK